ncbi:MAG TPA: DUF4185 domain-containing protein [Chloroflexota bacterium]|nr:DUF4185 domain-containing protein [Chloroflexota bacterium]
MRRPSPRLFAILVLLLAAMVGAVTAYQSYQAAQRPGGAPGPRVHPVITLLAKIVGGDIDEPAGLPVLNQRFHWVGAADLGAITRYGDHWYLALGDTDYALPQLLFTNGNFLIATAPYNAGSLTGLTFDNYLALHSVRGSLPVPGRAILPDPGYTIPGSLFTVSWRGRQYLFAQYMEGGDFGGHDHWSRDSRIARYDDTLRIFRPYKPRTYTWQRRDRVATNANRLQYGFGQSAFWEDPSAGYLYMVGAPTNRFGGVKLARIAIASFLDPRDQRPWSYYLGDGRWSASAADEMSIDAQVSWLIPPRDPAFSLDKNYNTARYPPGTSQCSYLTIAEFSLVWDPYLRSFLLLTSSAGCPPNVLRVYTAPAIAGPWTQQAQDIPMRLAHTDPSWDYYAPYTTPSLLRDGGRTMYFLASVYSHYGIYLFKATFSANQPHHGGTDGQGAHGRAGRTPAPVR